MGILAVYDTVGIQNYIFASNKLAENVGASKIVADVFAEILLQVIARVAKTEKAKLKWNTVNTDGKYRKLSDELPVEIVYQGGGNAYVKYIDSVTESKTAQDLFQEVTKEFLGQVSIKARGIGIAVAAIETDFGTTYKQDFKKLNDRLSVVKAGFNTPVFPGNQPITKQSFRTGLPATHFSDNEYLNISQKLKRDRYDKLRKDKKVEIKDFDDLVFEKGTDSLIAIIHADGNSMGNRIMAYMEKAETYDEAVPKIRELSARIDKCYKNACERATDAFKTAYKPYIEALDKQGKLAKGKKDKETAPILELITDGDDITLVIGGKFAIDYAVRLLREIENTPEKDRPFEDVAPTASAGVVLFHSHYPFSEAYKLVEELCSSAKKPSREAEGSYIDFHLHQSGGVSSLDYIRSKLFAVEGKELWLRPWCVSKGIETGYPDISWLQNTISELDDMNKYPRSKVKNLRNAIGNGDGAADLAKNQIRRALPGLNEIEKHTDTNTGKSIYLPKGKSWYAAYFDALEIMDTYVNLLSTEAGGDIDD